MRSIHPDDMPDPTASDRQQGRHALWLLAIVAVLGIALSGGEEKSPSVTPSTTAATHIDRSWMDPMDITNCVGELTILALATLQHPRREQAIYDWFGANSYETHGIIQTIYALNEPIPERRRNPALFCEVCNLT